VPEAVDWKSKHLDLARELEGVERRWREIEQILRRLVGRLCTVALGAEPSLDPELKRLSSAVRHETDATELKERFDALSDAIRALDQAPASATGSRQKAPEPARPQAPGELQSPGERPATGWAERSRPQSGAPPAAVAAGAAAPALAAASAAAAAAEGGSSAPPPHLTAGCSAVSKLLDQLEQADPNPGVAAMLRADLAAVADDMALAEILSRAADAVSQYIAESQRVRFAAAATLAQVNDRLKEVTSYLAGSGVQEQQEHEARQTINTQVLAQMTSLTDEIKASENLTALRVLVTERIELVASSVRELREREQERFDQHVARSERMRTRIAELERESEQLHQNVHMEKQRSRIDPVTGVANRAWFDERFAEELARWKRFRQPVAVLIWDLDNFKVINDTCGHRGGDIVLREVAACLSRDKRDIDFFARIGGEEFISLLIGTPFPDAVRLAEQMRRKIEALRFHFHRSPVRITVSCGLTALREGDTADSVFDRADAALYKAKHSGRNTCVAA